MIALYEKSNGFSNELFLKFLSKVITKAITKKLKYIV